MTATVTEPSTTVDQLKTAAEALKAIDIRTLPRIGGARENVKDARESVASALRAIK